MSETADRVKKIVVEHLGVEAEKVTEDASFICHIKKFYNGCFQSFQCISEKELQHIALDLVLCLL